MKLVKAISVAIVLGAGIISITGCGEKNNPVEHQYIKENKTVKLFFWYGCPHCYAVHKEIRNKDFKDVKFEYIAVPGNKLWTYHAANFYALKRLNKLDQLNEKFFDFVQERHGSPSEAEILNFMESNGVDREAYKAMLDSSEVKHDLSDAERLAKQYGIQGVPGIFLDGTEEVRLKDLRAYSDVVAKIKSYYHL